MNNINLIKETLGTYESDLLYDMDILVLLLGEKSGKILRGKQYKYYSGIKKLYRWRVVKYELYRKRNITENKSYNWIN